MNPGQGQLTPYVYAASRANEVQQSRSTTPSDDELHYSERDICQLASVLSRDGNILWSKNPRLYIIIRNTAHHIGASYEQLCEKFIESQLDDTWLPIQSEFLLDCLLSPSARDEFLRVQHSICSQPQDVQLGIRSTHYHFPSKESVPFICRRIIGFGRIGKVDEVWCPNDGRVYARKIIQRRLSDFVSANKRHHSFQCEIQALRRIKHIHCVKLVGSYTNPRHFALVMSPVAECNLAQYLRQAEKSFDPIVPVRLRKWLGCLATAVRYLHDIKIRHRDIKPDNILVHGRRVLLVDFELCLDWKDLGRSTTTADCGRTPLYASPEVILHKKRNSSSDIWSLGCVFLEMATIIEGKRISDMRELFISQAENAIFYYNQRGITEWITSLAGMSKFEDTPVSWISKMLQHDKDLRPKAGAIINLIRNTKGDPNEKSSSSFYFGKCCQPDESTTASSCTPASICDHESELGRGCYRRNTNMHRSHIYKNPESTSEALTIRNMRSSFHPFFMTRHLTRTSMEDFTQSLVVEGSWDSVDANAKLSCLPGRPISLSLRRFVPKYQLFSVRKDPASGALQTQESLPLGIYRVDPLKLARSFNDYLHDIIEYHLVEHSEFVLRVSESNNSSRVLKVLFEWFQNWKETLPNHECLFMMAAIKIVVINKILGQLPIMEEMSDASENDFSNGFFGPRRFSVEEQSPRLVSRQVKVAFFLLQNKLLEQTLGGLKYLLRIPEAWTSCLFISMCLSFVLERMLIDGREYLRAANEFCEDETATTSDVDNFCHGVYSVVFQRIFRLLSSSIRTQKSDARIGTNHLLKSLRELQHQIELEGERSVQQNIGDQHPLLLVSALLILAEHI